MKKLYLFVFILFFTAEIFPQWVQTNGPYGGFVNALAVSGTNLFAGSDYGTFLSTNNGESWTAAYSGIPENLSVGSFAVSGSNIFAGTGTGLYGEYLSVYNGVYLSTNNGASWTEANKGLPRGYDTTRYDFISCLASDGQNLFAGTSKGVYLSTNNGTNWIESSSGIPANVDVFSFIISGANLFAGTNNGVYLSTNNGANWTEVNEGLPRYTYDTTRYDLIWCLTSNGTNIFAGTFGSGVYLSTNNGTSWTNVSTGLAHSPQGVRCLTVSGTNLFACTYNDGIFLSTNNGTSWTAVNSGWLFLWTSCLTVSGTNLFAGTSQGVFLSTNNGTNWTNVNSGLSNLIVYDIAMSGTNIYAKANISHVALGILREFLSTDEGKNWTMEDYFAFPINSYPVGIVRVVLYKWNYYDNFISINEGTTWTVAKTVPNYPFVSSFAVIPNDKGGFNLFAGTTQGVFLSTDNGANWSEVNKGLPRSYYNTTRYASVHCLASNGQNLFAGTDDGGISLSTNNGTNWVEVNEGLPRKNYDTAQYVGIKRLASNGTNIYAETDNGIFLSTNNGTIWTKLSSPSFGDTPYYIICFVSSSTNLFVGTSDGVFLSTNNGINWIPVNKGLHTDINSLAVCGTNLYANTLTKGVWRRPLSEMITAVETSTELPKHYILEQNYPNPFNPVTKIKYQIPLGFAASPFSKGGIKGGFVTLKVYDILGNEVATLVNEEKPAGTYEVEFNGSKLSSGIYFYQLRTGNFSETKKMLMMK